MVARATAGPRLGARIPILLAILALGCPSIHGQIPRSADPTPGGAFKAGAANIDITPIPGIPMGGYSIAGKLSRGFWTRLRARAIYLEDANGDAIVLVACDLSQIPNGLSDRVADLVAKIADLEHLGREQIVLAATHTHHGPGNFFTSKLYNSMSSVRPGWDHEIFDFIARRIVEAIEKARGNATAAVLRTPPALGTPGAPDDRLNCAFRNRSLSAFLLSRSAQDFLAKNTLPDCPADSCEDPLACRAVYPRVEFLEIAEAADPSRLIALAVFLAAHDTVLTPQSELFSADLFGAAAIRLEQGRGGCVDPTSEAVVALFNGAEGDVSPTWQWRDRREVIDQAERIADKVCSLLPGKLQTAPDVAFRFGILEPLTDREVDDPWDRELDYARRTAHEPLPGLSTLGGAEDGRTLLYEMGIREGLRYHSREEHGNKHTGKIEIGGLAPNIGQIVFEGTPPPRRAPLGIYRIGNVVLATLPGEFTTLMGERVRQHVTEKLAPFVPARVILVGLAGGYVSYVTTPEEYEAQSYEGGSNFYGAATGPLLAVELGELAGALATNTWLDSRSYRYFPGSARNWKPRDTWGVSYDVEDGLSLLTRDRVTGAPAYDLPTYCWTDAVPRLAEVGNACERSVPEVWIEDVAAGTKYEPAGVKQDNHGLDLFTLMTGVDGPRTEWCAVWLMPPLVDLTGTYRFRVEGVVGTPSQSQSFRPDIGSFYERPDPGFDSNRCGPLAEALQLCHPVEGLVCPPWLDTMGLCASNACEQP